MAYTMEQRMVCAQKQGRMMSIFARNMTRSAVEQEAKLLFSYVQEREAFMAGYEGERRRRAELDQRFRSSNHIRPPCRAYRPRCERRAPD